ncbi:MAG TPA: hypothetical protein VFQ51_04445 [Vicinamibacteria bacterium]|nr:hypothetical protein [Vicinamibacteria bacterium]
MSRAAAVASVVLAVALVALALWAPPVVEGDGAEYVLMCESLYRHGSPSLRPEDLEALRAEASPDGWWRDREPATLGAYFPASDGRRYAWHFWGYSLLAVPARALVAAMDADVRRALPITNAVCLGAMAAVVLLVPRWDAVRRALMVALLLGSPVLPFLRWTHPEPFAFAAAVCALALHERAPRASLVCAAVASWQAPPLFLLVILLWARTVAPAVRSGDIRSAALTTAAALPMALPPAFYLALFGTPNLAARQSFMRVSDLSVRRALDLALDLDVGLLPHTPGVMALAALALALGLARGRWRDLEAQLLATAAAVALAATLNPNWNNATSGPSRYAVWALPLVLWAVASPAARGYRPATVSVACALQVAILAARGGPLARTDYLEHSYAARVVLDRWPALYSPTHEIFVERTTGREQDFPPPPFIYRDDGRCRKALLRIRFAEALESECGPIPSGQRGRFFPRPADTEARNAWAYVSW